MHAVTMASIIQQDSVLRDDALARLESRDDFDPVAHLRAGLDHPWLEYPGRLLDENAGVEAALHERIGRHHERRVRGPAQGDPREHAGAKAARGIVRGDAHFYRARVRIE